MRKTKGRERVRTDVNAALATMSADELRGRWAASLTADYRQYPALRDELDRAMVAP